MFPLSPFVDQMYSYLEHINVLPHPTFTDYHKVIAKDNAAHMWTEMAEPPSIYW